MNILDTIVDYKRKEVECRKRFRTVADLKKGHFFKAETLSFKKYLTDPNLTGIVAEFKRQSPSKGVINATSSVVDVTSAYALCGASAGTLTR